MSILMLVIIADLEYEASRMEIIRAEAGTVIHLIDEVHLFDENIDITGLEAWFQAFEQSVVVRDSVYIQVQDADIWGDSLHFDTAERISNLVGHIVVKKGNTEISAPRMRIEHRERTAFIPYGAQIRDTEEGILITGEDVHYNLEEDRGSILRNPGLSEDVEDSDFHIASQRMHLDRNLKSASAAENVRIFTSDATVSCDTMILYYQEDRGEAAGSVTIDNPDGRIEADSADFILSSRELQEITLYPDVTTRYRTEGADSVVVDAPRLTIDMRNKDHEVLIFTGGVDGTYFWREEQSEEE